MKKSVVIISALALCFGVMQHNAAAQELTEAQKAAAAAAAAVAEAPVVKQKVEKPKYWEESLKTNIKFGQTSLTNWAAGGDNTVTLQAFIDGNANYKRDKLFWNNRLQLDYGFVYASSKPILGQLRLQVAVQHWIRLSDAFSAVGQISGRYRSQ